MKFIVGVISLILLLIVLPDQIAAEGHVRGQSTPDGDRQLKGGMGGGMGMDSDGSPGDDPGGDRDGETGGMSPGVPLPPPGPISYPRTTITGAVSLFERSKCAQPDSPFVVQTIRGYLNNPNRGDFKDAGLFPQCVENNCPRGCCRLHSSGAICDSINSYRFQQCICNQNTAEGIATPSPTPAPTPSPTGSDRSGAETELERAYRTCQIFTPAYGFTNVYAGRGGYRGCTGMCDELPGDVEGTCCVEYWCQCRRPGLFFSGERCVDPGDIIIDIPDIPGPGDVQMTMIDESQMDESSIVESEIISINVVESGGASDIEVDVTTEAGETVVVEVSTP